MANNNKLKNNAYIRNIPEKYRNGGDWGQGAKGGRPKLTEEEKQKREQEKIVMDELQRIALQQKFDFAQIYDELSKSGDVKLMLLQMLSRSAENGNPNVIKFMAQILGNLEEKENKQLSFEIKIAREL